MGVSCGSYLRDTWGRAADRCSRLFPCFSDPARRSAFSLKVALVVLHIVFAGALFLFDRDLIEKTKHDPWYTAMYVLLFIATLVQYFITAGTSPGNVLDVQKDVDERDATARRTLLASKDGGVSWIHSLLYLVLVCTSVHLFYMHLVSPKLSINHQNARFKKVSQTPLHFRADGTFKILQVADMHFGNGKLTPCRDVLESKFGCSDLNTTWFLERMIQLENPDFVAFTGDNIFGSTANDAAESLFQAFGPVMRSGIPWAAVLGNHDQESTMTREELMSFISLMDFSLSQTFPSVEDNSHGNKQNPVPNIDGFGNYNLRVWGAPGSDFANSTVLNLYFLDSGDRAIVNGVKTYDWIKESQLSWLRNVSRKLQEQELDSDESSRVKSPYSASFPSLAFFHIPIPEIKQGPILNMVGHYREYTACSLVNSGVLKTLVSVGDVKAVFMGHDHTNDFCGTLGGLWFCYGGGFGYHGYGVAGWSRRGRVILAELGKGEQSWSGVKRIRTWKRLDDERLSKIDEQVLWER